MRGQEMTNAIKKMDVLLVEDDEICVFLTTKILARTQWASRIRSVSNGLRALDFLNREVLPDVIFLDLNMPLMNGFSFLEAFQLLSLEGKDKVKIFVLSSSQSEHDVAKAKRLGATAYLSKPLTEQTLRSIF